MNASFDKSPISSGLGEKLPLLDFSTGNPLELNHGAVAAAVKALSSSNMEQYIVDVNQNTAYQITATSVLQALRPDVSGELPEEELCLILSHGAIGAINLSLRYFACLFDVINQRAASKLVPAVIIPRPCYGLLADLARINQLKVIFVDLDEKNGWKCDPALVRGAMEKEGENVFPIGFVDVSPHNPTGYLRSKSDALARYREFQKLTVTRRQQLIAACGGDEAQFESWRAADGAFRFATEFMQRMKFIDDMAYHGLEHADRCSTSYLELSAEEPGIHDDVFLALSASKTGVPQARAGALIVSKRYEIDLRHMAHRMTDCPNPVVPAVFHSVFSATSAWRASQRVLLERRSQDLRYRSLLCEAVVNGLHAVSGKTASDTAWLAAELAGTDSRVDGIPFVRILQPGGRAGMFHLIGFDREFWTACLTDGSPTVGSESERLVAFLVQEIGVRLLKPEFMALPGNGAAELVFRLNFDRPFGEMRDMAQRLRSFIAKRMEPIGVLREQAPCEYPRSRIPSVG